MSIRCWTNKPFVCRRCPVLETAGLRVIAREHDWFWSLASLKRWFARSLPNWLTANKLPRVIRTCREKTHSYRCPRQMSTNRPLDRDLRIYIQGLRSMNRFTCLAILPLRRSRNQQKFCDKFQYPVALYISSCKMGLAYSVCFFSLLFVHCHWKVNNRFNAGGLPPRE